MRAYLKDPGKKTTLTVGQQLLRSGRTQNE